MLPTVHVNVSIVFSDVVKLKAKICKQRGVGSARYCTGMAETHLVCLEDLVAESIDHLRHRSLGVEPLAQTLDAVLPVLCML